MEPPPASEARPRRILVIANETCASPAVVEEVAYRSGGGEAHVVVVAPALASGRMEHWLVRDSPRSRERAQERLESSLAAFTAAGMSATGRLGDADPLQALDDAVRAEQPDEVIISTHPPARSGWLERQVVRKARARYDLPITHIVVDVDLETATSDDDRRSADAPPPAPGVRLLHPTAYERAMEIRRAGFRDDPAGFEGAEGARGVFLVDRPPAAEEGDEAILFAVDVPASTAAAHELPPAPDGTRRFLVPASVLNRIGAPIAVGDWAE